MRAPLHVRTLLGAGLGAGLGLAAWRLWGRGSGATEAEALSALLKYVIQPAGQVFLRLLFMLVVPLLFSALALGVAGLGDMKSLGRVGLKTLAYTVCVSTIAVLIGVGLVNLFSPGDGISPEVRARLLADAPAPRPAAGADAPWIDLFVQMVPDNPVRAAAGGEYLALMFFALLFGIALAVVRSPAARALQQALEGLLEVTMWLIHKVILLAPFGVFALLFKLTADFGYELLGQLASYVGVVLLALALHQVVVYSATVRFLGGRSPVWFFRNIQAAMITAFSTASSNATLPTALEVAERNLKLPSSVARFVLTIGSTANQNGTALFEGVTVLFLAQVYGIELSFSSQVLVVVTAILGGIGTAGVPGGSMPVILSILGSVGVPKEGYGLILGVDRLLDMCRTTLNVTGDLAAAVVVSRGEADGPR